MQKYLVLEPFKGSPDGRFAIQYEKDDVVPNDDKAFSSSLAEVAVEEGWVKPIDAPSDDEAFDAEKINLIVMAIKDLDPDNEGHYTSGGKPEISAIKDVIGDENLKISASERDAAFKQYQEQLKAAE